MFAPSVGRHCLTEALHERAVILMEFLKWFVSIYSQSTLPNPACMDCTASVALCRFTHSMPDGLYSVDGEIIHIKNVFEPLNGQNSLTLHGWQYEDI